jgi:hypothetical protein
MAFRGEVATIGLRESLDFALEQVERAEIAGMGALADEVKDEWRDQVRAARLGERLTKAVRGRVYDNKGQSAGPAAFIWSKAPAIMSLFESGAAISAHNGGQYLWIPTRLVPRGRRRRAAAPDEVAARYGGFIFRPSKRTPGNLVALVKPLQRTGGAGRRRRGVEPALLHMFTLARVRRGTKWLQLDELAQRGAERGAALIEAELEGGS